MLCRSAEQLEQPEQAVSEVDVGAGTTHKLPNHTQATTWRSWQSGTSTVITQSRGVSSHHFSVCGMVGVDFQSA